MFFCWPKALCECCRQEAFRKSHQNFLQAWPWAFSKKKITSLCRIAFVPGEWEDATRFVLVVSVLINGSACAKRPHTHTLHTIHTHTHSTVKESCLAWLLLQTTRKVKRTRRKSRACCFVWEDTPLWNRLFTTSCFDFSTMFESFLKQELHKSALEHSWSECSSSTSRLIWSPKRHFVRCYRSTCCWENT